jgi:hypothetical protein
VVLLAEWPVPNEVPMAANYTLVPVGTWPWGIAAHCQRELCCPCTVHRGEVG